MSFDKYSNYDEKSSFSGVVFGSEKPILEVELNEMQQIMDFKFGKLILALAGGSCVIPLNDDSLEFDADSLTYYIRDAVAVSKKGLIAYVDSSSVVVSATNNFIYLEVKEEVKTFEDTIKKYGNELNDSIANTMRDLRYPFETTRRRVITYSLKACGGSFPSNDNCIPIGVYLSNTGTINRSNTSRIESLEAKVENL